jgi:hypothetical protein
VGYPGDPPGAGALPAATAEVFLLREGDDRGPKGNHPGFTLARRLASKAEQVWLFTTAFSVPWTNNASEQALKSPKLHQKVSGYWHTLTRFCRVRSYPTSACNHGLSAIDAIHNALTGQAWMPPPTTA